MTRLLLPPPLIHAHATNYSRPPALSRGRCTWRHHHEDVTLLCWAADVPGRRLCWFHLIERRRRDELEARVDELRAEVQRLRAHLTEAVAAGYSVNQPERTSA